MIEEGEGTMIAAENHHDRLFVLVLSPFSWSLLGRCMRNHL
jgi:hypothetical protein